jgi:hypothetical protein
VHRAPGIPHALIGRKILQTPGASRRGNAESSLNVIACDKREAFAQGSDSDEAIQLLSRRAMDCFANARNDGIKYHVVPDKRTE